MQIMTDSINQFLEETFHKEAENILISDLLLVESLTIDGKDFDNHKQNVSFQDLKLFKNLKYLEICNTLITNSNINLISSMPYLENLIIRDCTFNKQVTDLSKLKNIYTLRIFNGKNFSISYLSKNMGVKNLSLSGISLKRLNGFPSIDSLDICSCSLESTKKIEELSVHYLIISEEQFEQYRDIFLDTELKIMVMANPDEGYYIDKWVN